MEDGKFVDIKDDKCNSTPWTTLYSDKPAKLTANGHNIGGECSSPLNDSLESLNAAVDTAHDDKFKKRINPLRIHLGKRPFVENSLQFINSNKKKKPITNDNNTAPRHPVPRVPKLIPKRNQLHNVTSPLPTTLDDEHDKPVPRLVPKSQLLQFKKSKAEKGTHLKEYAQNLGLQPMVKFKCRKCCSMSFKTLAMLKEHQLICRAQAKEPTLSPEKAPIQDSNTGGPSRVTRKVYLCSACGTYYENWNLFLHMREVHNRHICLFCLGMFSKAEKLSSHLTNKHNVQEFNYENKEEFFSIYNGTLYLMCCVCDEICSEQDDVFNHDCNNVKPKPVPVLISKKSNLKTVKNCNMNSNGPTYPIKESNKPVCENKIDKKEHIGLKIETPSLEVNAENKIHCEKEVNNDLSEKLESETCIKLADIKPESTLKKLEDIPMKPETTISSNESSEVFKPNTCTKLDYLKKPVNCNLKAPSSPDKSDYSLPNGDERSLSDSSLFDSQSSFKDNIKASDLLLPPVPKEKEGIKLKLSLNNAKTPVIINSTVDPSIGQHKPIKPPSRVRKPPKRYEKNTSLESPAIVAQPLQEQQTSKTPSIKMTICDKTSSPFIKSTIFENEKESIFSTLNNNLESTLSTVESKVETPVKTTIYDNNIEDSINSLNRVPKLTVRVPKELLDRDSSSDYSSDSDINDKLTVDENKTINEDSESKREPEVTTNPELTPVLTMPTEETMPIIDNKQELASVEDAEITVDDDEPPITQSAPIDMELDTTHEPKIEEPEIPVIELTLDRPLDKYPLKDLLKVFLASTIFNCIYCNHARKIAVNCEQLALHMAAQHRFAATVDSITAEELMPETIASKVNIGAVELSSVYINLETYDSLDKSENVLFDYIFECFQCYFKTAIHKDLYLHNRKMHQKTILLCVMCKSNFYSYSELLCHLCPGTYDSECEIKFRCCLCNVDSIPSSFRLMVHLRKIHHTCDVCLEFCHSQARLSSHVWKHKLHHLCYRCGIAYRNKPDINNHLFWKHGTQSVLCKRCLQKKWPHVYHFCTPPNAFVCDECNLQFTKAVYLKVHKRFHSEQFPHVCTEEECTESFVSKKLLIKHINEHKKKELFEEKPIIIEDKPKEASKEAIPVIDLVEDDKPTDEAGTSDIPDKGSEQLSKKAKKKKQKEKDLMLDVNLPALNLSESDSSDESDSGSPHEVNEKESNTEKTSEADEQEVRSKNEHEDKTESNDDVHVSKVDEKPPESIEPLEDDKSDNNQKVLEIWDNFQKYQATVEKTTEKPREKTPPLVPIRRHVCDSDHDYCVIPTEMNGDDFKSEKKKNKKSPKKKHNGFSSSSSSSSDSDSSCSCGSNCSCSSSSGSSSSSSSSDTDSSDESSNEKRKNKKIRKTLPNRRLSTGSNVDVMGMSETPVLIPEKLEPPIPETDLETEESETDEEFYDENPQRLANKLHEEKRNQLLLLASVAPSDGGSISEEVSRSATPMKEEQKPTEDTPKEKEKSTSSKKKSKKKKKSKNSKKHGPIKINISKDVLSTKPKLDILPQPPLAPNKITISLQSNTVQIPETPKPMPETTINSPLTGNKRASKRRRVPNKFYGYSSDEETPSTTPTVSSLKPYQPPKLEWRKEDLPSPVTHKAKKEVPSSTISHKLYNYTEPIRLTAPIPDPEPPRILMNSESMESSDSDSTDETGLEIYQPNYMQPNSSIPAPTYLNSGTSSLPYAFQRPAVRQAREGESVYCYCRCPYDEVSEMIACDAEGCSIEWFHFECVGIMVPPKGKWYCPECRKNQTFSGYR